MPADKIKFQVNDEEREFFMSMALLNSIAKLMGHMTSVDMIPQFMLDFELREQALKALLSERSETGKLIKEVSPDDVKMSVHDTNALLLWATEHVLDFFMDTLTGFGKLSDLVAAKANEVSSIPPSNGSQS